MAQIVALQQLGRSKMLAMDWLRIRKTLQDLRIEKKLDVPELKRRTVKSGRSATMRPKSRTA